MSFNLAQTISGNVEVEVTVAPGISNNTAMTIANTHATDAVVVQLYIKDATPTTFYIMKGTTIAFGDRLVLPANEINIDTSIYSLFIKLNNADSGVDIITRHARL